MRRRPARANDRAFREAMRPLADAGRLGAVLAQFPFSFHATADNRGRLTAILDRFAELPLAVEFRHASWDTDETARLLSERGAAFVNIDQPDLHDNLSADQPRHVAGRLLPVPRPQRAEVVRAGHLERGALQLSLLGRRARAVARAHPGRRAPRSRAGRAGGGVVARGRRLRDPQQPLPRPGRGQRPGAPARADRTAASGARLDVREISGAREGRRPRARRRPAEALLTSTKLRSARRNRGRRETASRDRGNRDGNNGSPSRAPAGSPARGRPPRALRALPATPPP